MTHILSTKNKDTKKYAHGEKALSISYLEELGINTAPGFILTHATFELFAQSRSIRSDIHKLLSQANKKSIHTIEHASTTIRSLILNTALPEALENEIFSHFEKLNSKYVAVRSSHEGVQYGPKSYETTLNTNKEALIKNIQRCWSSFFLPRCILNENNKKLPHVTLIVQEMVPAIAAGIMYTTHPISENTNHLVIEAGWGLGSAIAKQEIIPDTYIVSKDPQKIIEKTINKQNRALTRGYGGGTEWIEVSKTRQGKQVLTEKEILHLASLSQKIETKYKEPVKIEWAKKKDSIYILQIQPLELLS